MARKSVHTVPVGDGWGNRSSGASRVPKIFDTKAQALAAGRDTAQRMGAEHVIHNGNGRISGSNSYGNDPFPPRG